MSASIKPRSEIIFEAASKCGIELTNDVVKAINATPANSSLTKWVSETLQPTNILSVEELTLWRHLQKSRTVVKEPEEKLGKIPVSEDDFNQSIIKLHDSTKAWEAQSRIFQAQRSSLDALDRQSIRRSSLQATRQHQTSQQRLKEAQHVEFLNSERLAKTATTLDERKDEVERIGKTLSSVITQQLNSDDRTLEQLESLLRRDETTILNIEAQKTRIEMLAKALEMIHVEMLQDELDSVYLETLQQDSDGTAAIDSNSNTLDTDFEDDFQSLYDEIRNVATMLVTNTHSSELFDLLGIVKDHQICVEGARYNEVFTKLRRLKNEIQTSTHKLEISDTERKLCSELLTYLQQIRSKKAAKQWSLSPACTNLAVKWTTASRPPAESSSTNSYQPSSDRQTATSKSIGEMVFSRSGETSRIQQKLAQAASARRKVTESLVKATSQGYDKLAPEIDQLDELIAQLHMDIEQKM